MKKPVCRNADKALCAYFTSRNWQESLGKYEGKRLGFQLGEPMLTQLPLDFSTRLPPPSRPIIASPTWVDVSDIAAGVGFSEPVSISLALSDALEASHLETANDYDQRLYDALWLAHFELSLNDGRPASFTFTFSRAHWKTGERSETSLRLRVEKGSQGIRLGLKTDF
jgi:hypothetical protein